MFEITEYTEAKLAVQNRTEKHGEEDRPAVTLGFEITTANTLLDQIDPGLRECLYKAKADGLQADLPNVEPSTPVLRSYVIDTVKLTTSHEGWRLLVDDGIDETTPMQLLRGKVDKVSVEPKQGGSVVLRFKFGTSDVDAERLGKLGMHNGQSVWIQLLKPEPKTEAIDGTVEAFQKDHPDAGELFSQAHGDELGGEGLAEGDEQQQPAGDAAPAAEQQQATGRRARKPTAEVE